LTRKPRIFIGLTDIASYYSGLKQGFDALGIEAVFMPLSRNQFSRNITNNPRSLWLSLVNRLLAWSSLSVNDRLALVTNQPSVYRRDVRFALAKLILLAWAACRCDVFIFGFGTTFFNYRELPLLRLLRKKIIYVFNGSDSRPPYISGKYIHSEFKQTLAQCAEAAARIKHNVRTIERYADLCVNHPPQAQFHERRFINHCFIGHPCSLPAGTPDTDSSAPTRAIRIVHAPTSSHAKGTPAIRELIGRLQRKGHAIEFIELVNRPNNDVLSELRRCDFVIDELYSDIPLAGLGTEAAFFGKPAVVGGYARAILDTFSREAALPTRLYVRPEQIERIVWQLVSDAAFRKEAGARVQAFIRENWMPADVAERFLRLIADDVPPEWWCDPATIDYPFGWGVSEETLGAYLAAYVSAEGRDALHMADKPALEEKLAALAAAGGSRHIRADPTS
jgi:hypothetical protein